MKYLEWNNLISRYFFNPGNAGNDVYLYITKKDIINIARNDLKDKKDHEIWNDFLLQLRTGLPDSATREFNWVEPSL